MKCKQCGKGGFKGAQGLRMHTGRVHTNTIRSFKQKRKYTRKVPLQVVDGEVGVAVATLDHDHSSFRGLEVRERNIEVRERSVEILEPSSLDFGLNYCPNCSFPVSIVDNALTEEQFECSKFCCNCTFPMGTIRTAIRLSNKQYQTHE